MAAVAVVLAALATASGVPGGLQVPDVGLTQAIRVLPRVEAVRRAYRLDLVAAGSWRHLAPLFFYGSLARRRRLGGRFVALSGLGPPLY